jgi:hypothetical protein
MSGMLEVYRRAQALGLRVETDGCDLLVIPACKVPPDFVEELKAHKPELVAWLSRPTASTPAEDLPGDEILHRFPSLTCPRIQPIRRGGTTEQWIHIAKQIASGEFGGADASTIEALFIGLRSIPHPTAREALRKLAFEPSCPPGVRKDILSLH